jgi:hypothetical protein
MGCISQLCKSAPNNLKEEIMNLQEAMAKIKGDPELAKTFTENPKKVLGNMGVDTENLKIKEVAKAEAGDALTTSACVSIGCVACASVGT